MGSPKQLPTGPHKAELMAALETLIAFIGNDPLDARLEAKLNDRYGFQSEPFAEIQRLLRLGIDEGWACYDEIDGPNYCRGRLADTTAGTQSIRRGQREAKGRSRQLSPTSAW